MTINYNKIINYITSNNIDKFNNFINKLDKNDQYIDIYILNNLQVIFNKINNNSILITIINIIIKKNNYIYFLDIITNLPDDYKIIDYNKYVLLNYIIKQNNKIITNTIILLNIFNIKLLNFLYNNDNNIFDDILNSKLLYGSHINIILITIILINLKLSNIINLNNYNNIFDLIKDINTNTYLMLYMINNIYISNKDFINNNHFIQSSDFKQNIYDIYNNDNIKYQKEIIIDSLIYMLSINDKLVFKYTYINNKFILKNYKIIYYSLYYELFDVFNLLLLNLFDSPLVDIYELLDYSSQITSIHLIILSKKQKLRKYCNDYVYIKKLLDSIESNTYII